MQYPQAVREAVVRGALSGGRTQQEIARAQGATNNPRNEHDNAHSTRRHVDCLSQCRRNGYSHSIPKMDRRNSLSTAESSHRKKSSTHQTPSPVGHVGLNPINGGRRTNGYGGILAGWSIRTRTDVGNPVGIRKRRTHEVPRHLGIPCGKTPKRHARSGQGDTRRRQIHRTRPHNRERNQKAHQSQQIRGCTMEIPHTKTAG